MFCVVCCVRNVRNLESGWMPTRVQRNGATRSIPPPMRPRTAASQARSVGSDHPSSKATDCLRRPSCLDIRPRASPRARWGRDRTAHSRPVTARGSSVLPYEQSAETERAAAATAIRQTSPSVQAKPARAHRDRPRSCRLACVVAFVERLPLWIAQGFSAMWSTTFW
jgi:hypothetical protein